MGANQIITTKITPPRVPPRGLLRARVMNALNEATQYRLTLLQANAGYGKSTALIYLAEQHPSVIWYQVSEEHNDIFLFLLHLLHATRRALPQLENLPIPLLEEHDNLDAPPPFIEIVHQYLNILNAALDQPTLLILDDVHLVLETNEIAQALDCLIGLAPANLSVVLAAREPIKLPNLARWRSYGDVLSFDQRLLKFTPEEIKSLYAECYQHPLSATEITTLYGLTEGWAIALQLAWQSLRSGAIDTVDALNARDNQSLKSLFAVLTNEVFTRQPEDMQAFMRITSMLRVMTPPICDALREATDSKEILDALLREALFVIDAGEDGLRYHPIFKRFLQQQSAPEQRARWHHRAAAYYAKQGEPNAAIYHYFRAEEYHHAARLLNSYGAQLLAQGSLDTLAGYLDTLPPESLHQHPTLLSYLGDLARLHSRFQEALGWYQQAETLCRERGLPDGVGRALRGQARVYLDTVSPTRAEELLQKALRLSDGTANREAQARLYQLLAENKLNAGKLDAAEALRKQAEALRREGPADSQLEIRVLLRTGRLSEARQRLEALVETERAAPVQTPRSHRETQLLLAFIDALQGLPQEAYQAALQGTRRGEALHSPFVTAVGYMRQGHALALMEDFTQARRCFEQAVEMSRSLAVPRLRVEACWGLCRTFGYLGDLDEASRVAQEGIQLANQAGDEWNASLTRLIMGANLVLAGQFEPAVTWLNQAARGFNECSDTFGFNVARLWLVYGWYQQGDSQRLAQMFPKVLTACRQHNYDFIFTRPTLLGVPNERLLVPLLIYARRQQWEGNYPQQLLDTLGLSHIQIHPGFQLHVRTLGNFQAWRGADEIPHTGWRREKARQLFQILLTYRNTLLPREQICEYLWPGAAPKTSQRNFKVALSTLYSVLEPDRISGSESAFVLREDSNYGLRPAADIWLDVVQFERCAADAEKALATEPVQALETMRSALELYRGEYLPDSRYESWAAAERERLAVLYLHLADAYCKISLEHGQPEEVIQLCQTILGYDNCWERAYRHLMLAYASLGDHGQIARTYQRCVQVLRDELDVNPAPETEMLYQKLVGGNIHQLQ